MNTYATMTLSCQKKLLRVTRTNPQMIPLLLSHKFTRVRVRADEVPHEVVEGEEVEVAAEVGVSGQVVKVALCVVVAVLVDDLEAAR